MGQRRKRRSHYDRPHVIYTLADPRTRAIRYVGRTSRDLTGYIGKRIRDAREDSREPVDRWICRLRRQGLEPIVALREAGAPSYREGDWSESLVRRGARLLNLLPCDARLRGRILVDLERYAGQYVAEIVHLGVTVKAAREAEARQQAAVSALRRLADLLEHGGPQYEAETALFATGRLFDWCHDGKVQTGLGAAIRMGRV